jgi:CelD/BcsL family acetyltransferase involved in cellulose biosynthesis
VAASIEAAIAEGLSRYDLLQGDEAYKSRWTTSAAEAATLIVARSRAARAALHAEAIKETLKRTVSRCLGEQSWERARRLWTGKPTIST